MVLQEWIYLSEASEIYEKLRVCREVGSRLAGDAEVFPNQLNAWIVLFGM